MSYFARCVLLLQACVGLADGNPQKLLLVDDHEVLYRAGLKRALEPLERVTPGKAVISASKAWEGLFGYVSVHQADNKLYLFYQCYSENKPYINGSTGVCLAISEDDGKSFQKPNLDVFTHLGQPTNVVFNPGPGFYFGSVLYEPHEIQASRRWKMIFWHMEASPGLSSRVPGLYTALSPDGIHWEQQGPWGVPKVLGAYGDSYSQPPLVSQNSTCRPINGNWETELSQSDAMNIFWDPRAQEYRVYAKTWIDGIDGSMFWKRGVALHTSQDFDTWAELPGHLCLYPDEYDVGADPVAGAPYLPGAGATGVELHAGPVTYLPDAGLYIMLIQHLDWTSKPNSGNLVAELGISRDGKAWSRPFRSHLGYSKFLEANPAPNQFDSGTLWTNAQFIASNDGKTQRLFYGAYQAWNTDMSNPAYSGIGVAQMVTDRFAGLTPINASFPGAVTLKPVNLSGVCRITANVDTSQNGQLSVELLSAKGYVIDGFSKMNFTAIRNVSDIDVVLSWESQPELPQGEAMLRAHLLRARLYGFSLYSCSQRPVGHAAAYV